MADPVASVRVRLHELTMEWLEAVAALMEAIDEADLEGPVADAADVVREVMFRNAREA